MLAADEHPKPSRLAHRHHRAVFHRMREQDLQIHGLAIVGRHHVAGRQHDLEVRPGIASPQQHRRNTEADKDSSRVDVHPQSSGTIKTVGAAITRSALFYYGIGRLSRK